MKTVEISVSTQNWWVGRQVQRTCKLERLLHHIFNVYFRLFCYSTWKIQVDVYVIFRTYAIDVSSRCLIFQRTEFFNPVRIAL